MNQENTPSPISRRGFLAASAVVIGAQGIASARDASGRSKEAATEPWPAQNGPFKLTPLPYAENALEPHISAKTLEFHHGKHHRGYVEKLNKLIEEKQLAASTLTSVIASSAKDPELKAVFNNAAQTWNHTFYWGSMKPKGGGEPSGKLADKLKADLGGMEGFKKAFAEAANGQFGSGWAWLVVQDGKLAVTKTGNADTPIAGGGRPLLVCDVWEHAYYLDYQNKRVEYVTAFLEHLVNWEFAASQLG
ncbi:MAG: superoxide dismutase [Planctomycetota bacterium]